MGTYNLPRNVKGEGKILFIFSNKGFVWTCAMGTVGILFYLILSSVGLAKIGMILTFILALIGYVVGSLKVPDTNGLEITRKTGGENIDDVIIRYLKFKNNKKKLYVYTKEEE